MLGFNGGTTVPGASIAPLGIVASYALLKSGNFWIGLAFLTLTTIYFLLVLATLSRYIINTYRNKSDTHTLPNS